MENTIIGHVYRVIYNCHAEEWGYENSDFGTRRSELSDHGEKVVIFSRTITGKAVQPLILYMGKPHEKSFFLCHGHFSNRHDGLEGFIGTATRETRTLGQIMADLANDFPNQYESYTCALISAVRTLFELDPVIETESPEETDESPDDEQNDD